jgi:uncharacterized membrane protein
MAAMKNSKRKRTVATVVFVLLCAACLGHAFYFYSQLPERVAHHFGPDGKPDAWGDKMQFLVVYLITIAVMGIVFFGLALAMRRLPTTAINLPHREYWLAPERREETVAGMVSAFLWFGSLTLLLFLDIFHQAFQVHLGKAAGLTHPWISIGVYLAASLVWCVVFFRGFRSPVH